MLDFDLSTLLTLLLLIAIPVIIFFGQKSLKISKLSKLPTDEEIEAILQPASEDQLCGEVAELFIHPLKAAKPLKVNSMELDRWGPKYDRKWFVADAKNNTKNAKNFSKLIFVEQSISNGYLVLETRGLPPLRIKLERDIAGEPIHMIDLYDVKGSAIEESQESSAWITAYLDCGDDPVRLMRSVDVKPRSVDELFTDYKLKQQTTNQGYDYVQFADLTSLLVTSQESLRALNKQIQANDPGVTVDFEDFRPNIVLSGVPTPYGEDNFELFRINNVFLKGALPCIRCRVTTVDKTTGKTRPSGEPLKTLNKSRGIKGRGCFGQCSQHLVKSTGGTLSVGDKVFVRKFKVFPYPFAKDDLKAESSDEQR